MRLIIFLTLFFSHSTFANLPEGFCYTQQCDGTDQETPYDFAKKVLSFGDPNGNGTLKSSFLAPISQNSSKTEKVDSKGFFDELSEAEDFAANQCGESLNNNHNDNFLIIGPCLNNSTLDRKALIIKNKHRPGPRTLNKYEMNNYFNKAKEKKEHLEKSAYVRNDGLALNKNECQYYNMLLGDKNIFAVTAYAKACYKTYVPKIPNHQIVHVGIVPRAFSRGENVGRVDLFLFKTKLNILESAMDLKSPLKGKTTYFGAIYYLGNKVYKKNIKKNDIVVEDRTPIAAIDKSITIPFPIGPLVLQVTAGVRGNANISTRARLVAMWANGNLIPQVATTGYVDAGISAWIAKAGAEGKLTFMNNKIEIYGFNGITPSDDKRYFVYASHVAALDTLKALDGSVSAYAKIRVPKFIGFRWKKWSVSIFSWEGINTSGYVFNKLINPTRVDLVKN